MENTYNYLKNPYHDLKEETKQNPLFLFLLLILFTIPMGYAVNGIAVGLFALATLITFKRKNIKLDVNLIIHTLRELGWSGERAYELGLQFEFAESLLSYVQEQ